MDSSYSSYSCTCLSESDVYTNYKFCGKKEDHIQFYKDVDLQSQTVYVDKKNLGNNIHILQDSARGNIKQVLVKILFQI